MNTIWYSLAWKEWHEHKWKLAAIVATLWGVAISVLAFYNSPDIYQLAIAICMICIIPLSIFVGLGAAANERARGTLPFLQSLPAPMWRIAVVKLLFGLISLIVPIALTALFFYAWSVGQRFTGHGTRFLNGSEQSFKSFTGSWVLDSIVVCAPIAASLFVWAATLGMNRRDEVSAGAVSLAGMVGWSLVVFFAIYARDLFFNRPNTLWFETIGLPLTPIGIMFVGNCPADYRLPAIAVAVLTHVLLLACYVGRYGRLSNAVVLSPQAAISTTAKPDWLSPPRRSALTAIAWKQLRESGPVVVVALAASVAVASAIIFGDFFAQGNSKVFTTAGDIYSKVAISMGFLVALVLGIGVCYTDMDPKITTFWRSRPVQPDLWFAVKFISGLLVLATSIYVPVLVLAGFGATTASANMTDNALMLPSMQFAIFSSAVAMTCLVRNAVYAAVLSIPLLYCGGLLAWAALRFAYLVHWTTHAPSNVWLLTEAQAACGFSVSFAIATVVAWLAMRNEWGWKGRN